jgi:hypothetical protein
MVEDNAWSAKPLVHINVPSVMFGCAAWVRAKIAVFGDFMNFKILNFDNNIRVPIARIPNNIYLRLYLV